MIALILLIILLSDIVLISIECIRIKKLEARISQLNLDVEMLIQNSRTLDK